MAVNTVENTVYLLKRIMMALDTRMPSQRTSNSINAINGHSEDDYTCGNSKTWIKCL